MTLEYINGQRGSKILVFNNYLYNFHSLRGQFERWRCRVRKCKGYIEIFEGEVIHVGSHDHEMEDNKIIDLRITENIKRKAIESRESASIICAGETRILEIENLTNIKKLKSMKKQIERSRQLNINFEGVILDDIPEVLKYDYQGNKFLLFDLGNKNIDRFIIFGSDFKKEYIRNSKFWIIDGTFENSPKGYYQILIIHTFITGKSYPILYVLMHDKKQATYDKIFYWLKTELHVNHDTFITDFEKGLTNSLQNIFPVAQHFYCHFHYSQAIYSKIKGFGLNTKYIENFEFRKIIKSLFNLPFFPLERIVQAYETIKKKSKKIIGINFEEIFEYFENTYFGQYDILENRYNESFYKKVKWNCHKRVLGNIPRTSNNAEAFHRVLSLRFNSKLPNISSFIVALCDEEELHRVEITQNKTLKTLCSRKNLIHEEKIRIVCAEHMFYSDEVFLQIFEEIYNWEFN